MVVLVTTLITQTTISKRNSNSCIVDNLILEDSRQSKMAEQQRERCYDDERCTIAKLWRRIAAIFVFTIAYFLPNPVFLVVPVTPPRHAWNIITLFNTGPVVLFSLVSKIQNVNKFNVVGCVSNWRELLGNCNTRRNNKELISFETKVEKQRRK